MRKIDWLSVSRVLLLRVRAFTVFGHGVFYVAERFDEWSTGKVGLAFVEVWEAN
jgi:hypothetical protein